MASDRTAAGGNDNEARDEFRAAPDETTHETTRPDPSVLEDVLRETIASDADVIDPEQMEALREVARRHADTAFAVDPVGVGLTEAILGARYKAFYESDEQWRAMSLQIAESLFEAENVRQRIRDFWSQLCESVR